MTNLCTSNQAVPYADAASRLPIAHTEKTIPFEIHTLKWIEKNRWPQHAVPQRHNHFEIIWVKCGTGVHLIDLEKHEIEDDTIYYLTPGQVHLLKASRHSEGYLISFSAEFIGLAEDHINLAFTSELSYACSQSPVIQVSEAMKDEMQDILERMMKEYNNYFLLRAEVLKGFLKIFLIYLTRQSEKFRQKSAPNQNAGLVKRFLSLLDKNFMSKKMVADYARELCVTPNYLNEMVKKVSGIPASEHIKRRIILEAKRQASYTDVSMKEIAYNLGFNDTSHFSKFFKNASGISFTDFKKKQRHPYHLC